MTPRRHPSLAGLQCHPTANALYRIQSELVGERPYYAMEGVLNGWHLYWSKTEQVEEGGVWVVDDDTADDANAAHLGSMHSVPTCGTHTWREYCPGANQEEHDWIQSSVTITCTTAEFQPTMQNASVVGKMVKIPSLMESYVKSLYGIMLAELPENPTVVEESFTLVSVIVNSFIYGTLAATLSSVMMMMKAP